MEEQNRWELLSRYLAGECTEREKREVESWANSSAEAKEEFKQYNAIWEATSKAKAAAVEPDTDKMWRNILYRIDAENTETAQMNEPGPVSVVAPDGAARIVPFYKKYSQVAAAVVFAFFVAMLAYLFFTNYTTPHAELSSRSTGAGEKAEFLLADGTHIWLNEQSSLRYPVNFNNGTREVYLEGEAFFEVARDEQQPFIIYAGQAITQVLGTSFNVQAINKDEVAVTVVSGKVMLYDAGNADNKVLLEKGDRGIYYQKKQQLAKDQNKDLNFLAWQTGVLTFRNTEVSTMVSNLEMFYNVQIKVANDAINNCRITATFDNQPLEEVLEVLSLTLDINYVIKGDKIIFKGEGCS